MTRTQVCALIVLAATAFAFSEKLHQSLPAKSFRTGDGKDAVEKGVAETREVKDAESKVVTRVKGDMNQWGYVTAWFGVPTPAGKSTVRLRIYVSEEPTAKYMTYINTAKGQVTLGELKVPGDAKPETFIDVDVPVDASTEWSGFTLKKADTSKLPSPWLDTLRVILPE